MISYLTEHVSKSLDEGDFSLALGNEDDVVLNYGRFSLSILIFFTFTLSFLLYQLSYADRFEPCHGEAWNSISAENLRGFGSILIGGGTE